MAGGLNEVPDHMRPYWKSLKKQIEVYGLMDVFYICVVHYGSHLPPVVMQHLKCD